MFKAKWSLSIMSIFFSLRSPTPYLVMIYPLLFIGLSSINKIQLLIGDLGFYFKKNIGYKSQETLKEFGAYKIPVTLHIHE